MATQKWVLEPNHSELEFKVKHMMISNVTGQFKKIEGTVETDGDDFTTAKVHFTADVESISTNNEQRDGHLKSAEFFDAENHPQVTFESTNLEKMSDEDYKLHGNLTMHGVTKPVTLDVEYGGMANDNWGNIRAGFTVSGKLSRKEFDLKWNALTESGGVVVSDDVKLHASIQFVKQQVEQPA